MSDAEVIFEAPVEKPGRKTPKKAKRAKPAKAAPRAPKPAAAASTAPFPGLTRTVCADGCGVKGCVISGRNYCAHPTKGGLQAGDMNDPAALKRLQNARAQLDVRVDPDRFK